MIGITQRLEQNSTYYEIREALSLEWGELLSDVNFIPLSYTKPIEKYNINGIILSGGNDLSHLNPNNLSILRDKYENNVIKYAIESNTPILGVCRGAQMLAYYFDSTLQKMPNHVNKNHTIKFQDETYKVNSFHNYCITKLGEKLQILATADDDTIESFRHKDFPIFGMMWHIEREKILSTPSKEILESFFKYLKG